MCPLTLPEADVVYSFGSATCSGVGLSWSDEAFNAAMDGPVTDVLHDKEGTTNLSVILTDLVDTAFAQEGLKRVLETPNTFEDWRVGEAIAEAYLIEYRSCYFPWPDSRDERKRGSSLPGADLVGFAIDSDGDCLAFGEVKTSSDVRYPPGSMYGRSGLKRQIEDLRDSVCIRDDLLKYLAHRAQTASWRPRLEAACIRYFKNSSDIQLFGVLVRDVQPNGDDLRTRVQNLAIDCPAGTRIELLALYLPLGRIDGIGHETGTFQNRGCT